MDTRLEEDGDEEEAAEEDDLDKQPADDDVLADFKSGLRAVGAARHESATCKSG